MISIRTKQLRKGTWCCFATVAGYDYSFEAKTIENCQNQMDYILKKYAVGQDYEWRVAVPYVHEEEPKCDWQPPRLDHNPIA